MSNDELFGEIIYAYTRAQALEDGVLVDVSQTAQKAGFTIPVAVTKAVWNEYIYWDKEDDLKQVPQNLEERLLRILKVLKFSIKSDHFNGDRVDYQLLVIPRNGESKHQKSIKLKALIHGDDKMEPVITIMLPDED